jgi:hypothetical protein
MKPKSSLFLALSLLALARPLAASAAGSLTPVEFSDIGIPYGWKVVLDDASSVTTTPDHVGAWSWDEDNFPATAKGWTHTSKWVQLELTESAALTLKLESLAGAPWPSAEDPARLAGTNLYPSFTIYRGWDTDSGTVTNADGTTLDQDHTFNNRGNIEWAEDVTYLDHLENGTTHEATRTWVLAAGKYTINLGGNSPATLAEGRQGYQAAFSTVPAAAPTGNSVLAAVEFSEVGIPYGWKVVLDDASSVTTTPDHVGAWSWDEDNFPATAKGWTHTSKWVQLELTESAALTLKLESLAGAPWPSAEDPARLAGTNLYPSFTIYRGWDTDSGTVTNADGTTLDQDHTFNNRGNIEWAEDVTYLDHLENGTTHEATRTWVLAAGKYTINLGGNSPATLAEGRQGYQAAFSTVPAAAPTGNSVLAAVEFSEVGIPYGWKVVLDDASSVTTTPDHVGAWSWDEDNFPATAKGWTHTSKWVQLELTESAALTLKLESLAGAPWPSAEDPARLAGTNLYPSFTIYRGWDTDSGTVTNADGTTLDQDHTFNNRGNIEWAEDVTYLDHLENGTTHEATRTWVLAAGKYTINLGGNSPATLAEGRQGYRAAFSTVPAAAPTGNSVLAAVEFSEVGIPYGWKVVLDDASSVTTTPDHVGAWSWDEDNFPATAKGWTHTSKWVQLELTESAALTLKLESLAGAPWPSAEDPARLAGTNLYPSFTIYRGWDTDSGTITNADGTTLDQDHTFNNRGEHRVGGGCDVPGPPGERDDARGDPDVGAGGREVHDQPGRQLAGHSGRRAAGISGGLQHGARGGADGK